MGSGPTVLTFYRADSWRGIGRGLAFSGVVMTLGALGVAASFLCKRPLGLHETLFAVGIALVVFGGLTTIVGFTRALRDDACIVPRTDGIVLLGPGTEQFFAWDELRVVRFDEALRAVVLEKKSGDAHRLDDRRYGDAAPPELAKALDEMRRKAEWKLLKP